MVVQNERYDDWKSTVVQLRTMFNQYNGTVLGYHQQDDCRVPPARNSTAAEGNFLEVLNMGLNSNHYITQINANKHWLYLSVLFGLQYMKSSISTAISTELASSRWWSRPEAVSSKWIVS